MIRSNITMLVILVLLVLWSPMVWASEGIDSAQQQALQALVQQSKVKPNLKMNKRTGVPSSINTKVKTDLSTGSEKAARTFFDSYQGLFKMKNHAQELILKRAKKDTLNRYHIKFRQVYQGIPVFGHEVIVHIDPNDNINLVNGNYLPGLEVDTQPAIGAEKALDIAKKDKASIDTVAPVHNSPMFNNILNPANQGTAADKLFFGKPASDWSTILDNTNQASEPPQEFAVARAPELVILDKGDFDKSKIEIHLCWKMTLSPSDTPAAWVYFVDAHTGKVVFKYNDLKDVRIRNTYTANNLTVLPGTLWFDEGYVSPNADTVGRNAHDNVGTSYDYFFNTFVRDSFDGNGCPIVTSVHYKSGYNNACWNPDLQQFIFGDGDGVTFSPLGGALDVVAHEYAHAVIQYEADLTYAGESGALNESFSDVFGEFTELYHGAGVTGEWLLGEDCYTPTIPGDALRSMRSPHEGNQPDHFFDYLKLLSDNGGVHYNSGIGNKLAYLITNGDTFNTFSVTGIGRGKAEQIYYKALSDYLTPLSDFSDLREALIASTADLNGTSGPEYQAVVQGLNAVGLGPDSDGDGLPDVLETNAGTYNTANKKFNTGTNPNNSDSDGDGISDGDEVIKYHTNPLSNDTDGDGIRDSDELFVYHTDPLIPNILSDGWGEVQELFAHSATYNTSGVFVPRVAIDGAGNATAVWIVALPDTAHVYEIWGGRFEPGKGWFDVQRLSEDGMQAFLPNVAADENGDVMVVWRVRRYDNNMMLGDLYARVYHVGTGWSEPHVLPGNVTFFSDLGLSIKNSHAVVVWQESVQYGSQAWSAYFDSTGGWQAPQRIDNVNGNIGYPSAVYWGPVVSVSIDYNGKATAAWAQSNNANQGIMTSVSAAGGPWSTPTPISDGLSTSAYYDPQIAVHENGNALAVWYDEAGTGGNVYAAQYNGISWENAQKINPGNSSASCPRLAMNDHGNAVLVWSQSEGAPSLRASLYSPATGWGPAEVLDAAMTGRTIGSTADVQMNTNGDIVVTWTGYDPNFTRLDLWSKNYIGNQGWQPDILVEYSVYPVRIAEMSPFAAKLEQPRVALAPNGYSLMVWLQENEESGYYGPNLMSNAFNPLSCNDGNRCTTWDVFTGEVCSGTLKNCSDGNSCTTDFCDITIGCSHTNLPDASTCDEGDLCTTGDVCSNGVCAGTPMNCNDYNACTIDGCDAGICVYIPITFSCDDGDLCTTGDVCSGGVCAGTPKNCDDGNACTTDTCNTASGCLHTPIACNDNDACTTDTCNTVSGCVHTPIACNDNDACTTDTCNTASGCVYIPIACNDNDACTTDTCNSATGCVSTHIVCNDNNACTTDTCNMASGCVYAPIACSDNDACTTDTCNTATGCVFTPFVCNDNNACTTDTCNTTTGCVYTPIVCNDNNACTTDTCNVMSGTCGSIPIICNDNNACTTDTCNSATGCVYTPVACHDNNACTTDTCNPATGCVYAAKNCNDNNSCTTDTCNTATGACVYTAKNCNDNNSCTTDTCSKTTGACIYTARKCNDNNACTTDSCNPATGCVYTPLVCNDNNSCTAPDSCNTSTGCVYPTVANGTVCGEVPDGRCQTGKCVSIDLVPTAMTATKSGTATVVVNEGVKNQGTTTAGSFTIKYFLSTDTIYNSGTDIALALRSNGTGICSRTVSSLSNGLTSTSGSKNCYKPSSAVNGVSYYVLVVDDVDNSVSENNENNNVFSATTGTIRW